MTTATTNNPLARIAAETGIPAESAEGLLRLFSPLYEEGRALVEEAARIEVTDATQVSLMTAAREMRLKLKHLRTGAENVRKELKENSLRTGKAIDGYANIVKHLIEPAEERLKAQEEFAVRAEAAHKAEIKRVREGLLAPYGGQTQYLDLANMPEDQFEGLLAMHKGAHEERIEEIRRNEEERARIADARLAEERRIREENERLRRDRERAETERREQAEEERRERERLAAERNAAEEKARKAEAELAAKQKAERDKAAAEARAKKKAEAAPDAEKLLAFALALEALPLPVCTTEEGRRILAMIADKRNSLVFWIKGDVRSMGGDKET